MVKTLEKRAQRSLCGLFNCAECEWQIAGRCAGCLGGNLARRRRGVAPCAIYECVRGQKIESCWQCAKRECPLEDGRRPRCVMQEEFVLSRKALDEKLTLLVERRKRNLQAVPRGTVSEPRLARARWYLAALEEIGRRGIRRISSYDLARAVGVKSALVRRDLSRLGHLGTPSVGYEVRHLKDSISQFFGLGVPCYWVGAARLAAEPSLVEEFAACHCRLAGVFDFSEEFIGKRVGGLEVHPVSDLKRTAGANGVSAAILALPPKFAQAAVDTMVEAGIKGILSLVSVPLAAPPYVVIQQADLPSQVFLLLARCRRSVASGKNLNRR